MFISKLMKTIGNSFFLIIGAIIGFLSSYLINGSIAHPTIFWSVSVGVAAGLVSYFIDFLIGPDQIFGFWGRFVDRLMADEKNIFRFLAKPLGGCIFCMNVWVCVAIFILSMDTTGLSGWYFVPVAAISHIVLAITDRKLNA